MSDGETKHTGEFKQQVVKEIRLQKISYDSVNNNIRSSADSLKDMIANKSVSSANVRRSVSRIRQHGRADVMPSPRDRMRKSGGRVGLTILSNYTPRPCASQ